MRKFKELEIWKSSKELTIDLYKLTKSMPKEEIYGLTSQMRRAAVSVPSNIAEGCSRSSNKEFVRFLEISIGSAFELETQLIIAQELDFIDANKTPEVLNRLEHLQMKINAFIKSVKTF